MICKYCKHEWNYKGKSKFYITCPQCYYKIRIERRLEEIENGTESNKPVQPISGGEDDVPRLILCE